MRMRELAGVRQGRGQTRSACVCFGQQLGARVAGRTDTAKPIEDRVPIFSGRVGTKESRMHIHNALLVSGGAFTLQS